MGVNRKTKKRKGNDSGMGGEEKEGDLHEFEILAASMLCSANLHHGAKFRAGRQAVPEIWPYIEFLTMAAVRHLGFSNAYPSEVQNASSCQILCRSVKALLSYGRFRFFK